MKHRNTEMGPAGTTPSTAPATQDMHPLQDEAAFAASLQQLLRDTETPLDYVSASRLAAARARAVAAAGERRTRHWWWALPGALATAALVAMTVVRSPEPPAPARAMAQAEVIELLGEDSEALAMYEDMDFYQWLSEHDDAT